MLFDPFEEEFHLPAAFVELGNREGWEHKIVGQKRESFSRFGVEVTDAPKFFGIVLGGVVCCERDRLIRDQTCGLVDGVRVQPSELEIGFGTDHKESQTLSEDVCPAAR